MSIDTETIVSNIKAMRRQEDGGVYASRDYMYQQQLEEAENPALGPLSGSLQAVTNSSRSKMVQWCYKVVDFCSFSRETVSIAMNTLDRFLLTPEGRLVLHSRDEYQLAAMCSLYTAVKIHEPEVMSAELVSTLSRGAHSPLQVEDMELFMLRALGWRINPPTALAFVRLFLELLPPALLLSQPTDLKGTLYEISKFQTELAVADLTLIAIPPSTIAYASVMNAMESLCLDRNIVGFVGTILSEAARINVFSQDFLHVQVRLCDSVTQHSHPGRLGKSPAPMPATHGKAQRRSSYEVSPCSVSTMEM